MSRRLETACLFTLTVFTVVFHAVTIPGQSLFVDEVSELHHACSGTIVDAAWWPDSMPPIYSLIVRGVASVLGEGRAVRWASVALSGLTTLVVWRIGRRAGITVGVASATVFALLPMQLYYAQLIRGYALFTAAAALALWAYLRAVESDRRSDWAWFTLAAILGMWCHYYTAILLIVLLGDLLLKQGVFVRTAPTVSALLIGIGCVPLLPFLEADLDYQKGLREPRVLSLGAATYTGFSLVSGYTLGPSKNELQVLPASEAAGMAWPWLLAAVIATGPLIVAGTRSWAEVDTLTTLTLTLLLPTVLVGLIGALSGVTYNPRFVAWCTIPLALLIGAGVQRLGANRGRTRWVGVACSVGLLAIFATAIGNRHLVDRYRTEDLAATALWLADNAGASAPVYVVSDYMAEPLRVHFRLAGLAVPTVTALPEPGESSRVVLDEDAAEEGVALLREEPGEFWLIESRPFHGDPRGWLHAAIAREFDLIQAAEFAGVRVHRRRND